MSFSIGIIGLPNVGKSTLFKALTKKEVLIAPYPFATINPNIGIVPVPDEKLEKIAKIADFKKITPAVIKFIDIAGLVKNAHRGEGLGNQFLSHIKECDGLLEIIKCFDSFEESKNVYQKDVIIVKNELIMKDLEVLENILKKLKEKFKGVHQDKEISKKISLLDKIKKCLLEEEKILSLNLTPDEEKNVKEYQFLTMKPTLYVFNIKEKTGEQEKRREFENLKPSIFLDLKIESEIIDLTPLEKKELNLNSNLDQLIIGCYNGLNLITFYTISGFHEARAWTLQKGKNILDAAEKIHSDFKEKFIKADVINCEELINFSSCSTKNGEIWRQAKEKGLIQTKGKDYIIREGDIIEIKI